jgi:hypothetical protein
VSGFDWLPLVREQLDWMWSAVLRPRFDGLSDDEYLWEPAPGCWSLRPGPDGRFQMDWARPAPEPPPVTTIAWRLFHVSSGLLARASFHFGDRTLTREAVEAPGTADAGLALLDRAYATWKAGTDALDEADLDRRSQGPPGTLDVQFPFAAVLLHVNREVAGHCLEVALLRDLYRARGGRP